MSDTKPSPAVAFFRTVSLQNQRKEDQELTILTQPGDFQGSQVKEDPLDRV